MPAYSLTPPKFRAFDVNGDPLVGGKLYSYLAGTSTPRSTYTDAGAATPNANPVILDANGEANVFITSGYYKFVLKDSLDVIQYTEDNISLPQTAVSGLPVGGTIRQSLKKIDNTDYSAEWVDTVKSTGTSSVPQNITAAGGIAFAGYADRSIWYVKSNTGAVTVTANPQIAIGNFEGQELKLVQMSATDTLQLSDGTGLALSGGSALVLDQVRKMAVFHWDATASLWVEQSRS